MPRRERGSVWECGTCPLTTEITVIFHRAVRVLAAPARGVRLVRRAPTATCKLRAASAVPPRRGAMHWLAVDLHKFAASPPLTGALLRTRDGRRAAHATLPRAPPAPARAACTPRAPRRSLPDRDRSLLTAILTRPTATCVPSDADVEANGRKDLTRTEIMIPLECL